MTTDVTTEAPPQPSWLPTADQLTNARVVEFARWVHHEGLASFGDASDFRAVQAWSAADPAAFWGAVARYFDVRFTSAPTSVLADDRMPGARWFPDATLNIAEHLLRHGEDHRTAVHLVRDDGRHESLTFGELRRQVGAVAAGLAALGVREGDRVAAYLPNCVEGVVAFLATASLGAVWSQTGMDYAALAAADRLAQLDARVLLVGGGYAWQGTIRDRRDEVGALRTLLPTVEHTVAVTTGGLAYHAAHDETVVPWDDVVGTRTPLPPRPVAFDHPMWVLFTSGTTGRPKGIVHGHGGVLLEQLVSPGFHLDLRPDDVFFWFTSPNWMMWNAQVCGLLHGATIVLYDGSPTSPATDAVWRVAAALGVTVLGTSPGYLQACERDGVEPFHDHDLTMLRTIGVTGAVLPPSANVWVREHVGPAVQLGSTSGGTDVMGIFVSSAPTLPVYDGEISGLALGAAVEVWDDAGRPVPPGTAGELVVVAPMPSMPVAFWNDPDGAAYRAAYFSTFPGVWRHGDLVTVTDRGTVVIHGRSDATLNRHGVRLGSAEIYAAVESLPEIADSLVVGVEQADGGYWMPLFVVPTASVTDADGLADLVRSTVAARTSRRHVPDEVVIVPALPRTRTGKKLEVPVKRLLRGAEAADVASSSAVDDTEAWEGLVEFARTRRQHRP